MSVADELAPGSIFEDRWSIEGVLGRGGFSAVYAARDNQSAARVALKVLKTVSESRGDELAARFAREVEVLHRLRAPANVRLIAHGTAQSGALYAVFEFVGGSDLSELMTSGPLAPPIVVHVLRQILAGLAEAHRLGVVHRDIKPANIRVFPTPEDPWSVKVLDYGIARELDSNSPAITATGEIVGTPQYMSPEQLLDQPLAPASDVYSLGIVAFEMLTGTRGSAGSGFGAQIDRLRSDYEFTAPGLEELSEPLIEVIRRMTAREPSARYGSAAATLAALDNPRRTTRKNAANSNDGKRRVALFGAVAVAVIAGLGAAWLLCERPTPASNTSRVLAASPPDRPTPADHAPMARVEPIEDFGHVEHGCEGSAPEDGILFASALDGGRENPIYVHVPPNYQPQHRYPLVVLLRENWGDAKAFLDKSGFREVADEHGFIVTAFDPPMGSEFIKSWRPRKMEATADWVGYLSARVQWVRDELCVDPQKIFVVGDSQGGISALAASCEPWVRAIALNSYRSSLTWTTCDAPLPVMLVSPRTSKHIPWDGGEGCESNGKLLSVRQLERGFRDRNRCGTKTREVVSAPKRVCVQWECDAALRSCYLDGADGWPGMRPRLHEVNPHMRLLGEKFSLKCDGMPPDVPLAAEIWNFFVSLDEPQ